MTRKSCLLYGSAVLISAVVTVRAEPPTDPQERKIYDHDKEWLSHAPSSIVATNIRGQGLQYKERRQAALDLVRQQRDFGVVSELMQALEEKSFLSDQIIDILQDWKAKRSIPLLKKIASDNSRDKAIRDKASEAVKIIGGAQPDHPPVYPDTPHG